MHLVDCATTRPNGMTRIEETRLKNTNARKLFLRACEATDGSIIGHTYGDGVCIVCAHAVEVLA